MCRTEGLAVLSRTLRCFASALWRFLERGGYPRVSWASSGALERCWDVLGVSSWAPFQCSLTPYRARQSAGVCRTGGLAVLSGAAAHRVRPVAVGGALRIYKDTWG